MVEYPYDVFIDQEIQRLLRGWFITVPVGNTNGLLRICSEYGADRCEAEPPATWALTTSGRLTDCKS